MTPVEYSGPQGSRHCGTAVAAVEGQHRQRGLQHIYSQVGPSARDAVTCHLLTQMQARGGEGGGAARAEGTLE